MEPIDVVSQRFTYLCAACEAKEPAWKWIVGTVAMCIAVGLVLMCGIGLSSMLAADDGDSRPAHRAPGACGPPPMKHRCR